MPFAARHFHRIDTPFRNSLGRLERLIRPLLYAAFALTWTISAEATNDGIRFSCSPAQLAAVNAGMRQYLQALQIDPALIHTDDQRTQGALGYSLATPLHDTNTLDLHRRPSWRIQEEIITLPARAGKFRRVSTVSKKEILLALLQHGRLTEFAGTACSVTALKEHIALRQNIVAWAEHLHLGWPNGGPARWNPHYWQRGTPQTGIALPAALQDAFDASSQYVLGCYTATKLIITQGVVDYFRRVQGDPLLSAQVHRRLYADDDPLVNIEPPEMWSFEADFDPALNQQSGKLLSLSHGHAPRNFVPGDWAYLLNTDPQSAGLIGYEGSNALYLGRDRFADLYNDNRHAYSHRQKIDEVYQWRNGVFSRSRDAAKIRKLSESDYERLEKTPAQGGLVLDLRATPHLFGHAPLPD
ncbi:hypothetical protein GCM10027046_11760 [Uliginosibacterium flavum]|uniref:Uncharacterized protein n=1 Tax=Uliginosibacterium flavum TaxID=1396831 RepID=A0ABV2TQH5_9RHOO